MSAPSETNTVLRNLTNCDPGEPNYFQYIKFIIQLLYVIPFGFLYGSFLITIIKKKKDRGLFGDSFFTLHLVDGFISLFFLFLDISFFRLTSYIRPACDFLLPLLKEPGYYLTPYFTVYLYVQLTKMLSTLAMNINRYTSVNLPIKHKTIWMNHCSKVIVAIFVLPLFFVWPVAICTTSFVPFNGQAVIIYDHLIPWARTTYARMLIAFVTLIFTVFSSIITSSKLRKLGKHMKGVEFSMTVATLFTSIGFVLLLAMQVCYLVLHVDTLVTMPWVKMLVIGGTQLGNDYYMLSGPVVLLILDKNIRRSTLYWNFNTGHSRRTTKVSAQRSTATH